MPNPDAGKTIKQVVESVVSGAKSQSPKESYFANVWNVDDKIKAGTAPRVEVKKFGGTTSALVFQTCMQSDNDGSGPSHGDPDHLPTLSYEYMVNNKGTYFNADLIPYMVLPEDNRNALQIGDLGIVFNLMNGKSTNVIYADRGPEKRIGEASIKTCQNLGVDINSGANDLKLVYIMFPGSGAKYGFKNGSKLPDYTTIMRSGDNYFSKFIADNKLS